VLAQIAKNSHIATGLRGGVKAASQSRKGAKDEVKDLLEDAQMTIF
jgi:hypothetical protein